MHIRYEWITLGIGALYDNTHPNVLRELLGAPGVLTVTTTATVAGNRPTAPAGQGKAVFARVTAIGGNAVAAWGADPTAAQNNGVVIGEGSVDLIPVQPGEKLSFVELELP